MGFPPQMKRACAVLLLGTLYFTTKAQCPNYNCGNPTITMGAGNCSTNPGYTILIPACAGANTATPWKLDWSSSFCAQTPTITSSVQGPTTLIGTFTSCPSCNNPYLLFLRDANDCDIGGAFAVNNPTCASPPSFIAGAAVQPNCNGGCNGSRSVSWSGQTALSVTFQAATQATISTYTVIPFGAPTT